MKTCAADPAQAGRCGSQALAARPEARHFAAGSTFTRAFGATPNISGA